MRKFRIPTLKKKKEREKKHDIDAVQVYNTNGGNDCVVPVNNTSRGHNKRNFKIRKKKTYFAVKAIDPWN